MLLELFKDFSGDDEKPFLFIDPFLGYIVAQRVIVLELIFRTHGVILIEILTFLLVFIHRPQVAQNLQRVRADVSVNIGENGPHHLLFREYIAP